MEGVRRERRRRRRGEVVRVVMIMMLIERCNVLLQCGLAGDLPFLHYLVELLPLLDPLFEDVCEFVNCKVNFIVVNIS